MAKRFSNKLTPAELERLALLSEELGEAQQAIGKILRHGYKSGWNGSNNRDDLKKELGDVLYGTRLLIWSGDLSGDDIEDAFSDKCESVQRFLHHQSKKLLNSVAALPFKKAE